MIYGDLIEYNIVGDTKTPLMYCFLFISKLKAGVIITPGQYMNYQTFSNLQFRPPLKNFFDSIHIDLGDTSGEKNTFCICRYHSSCFDVHKSLQYSFLTWGTLQGGCFKASRDSILKRYWSTTWTGIRCARTSYWENCNSRFAWIYRPNCKTRRFWLVGIWSARKCRGC